MPPNASEVAARTELFELIDARRADKVLSTLTEDAFVDREAYLHSKAMWRSGMVSHGGYRKRVRNIAEHDADFTVLCENVASAHGMTSAKAAARGVFRFWRSSSGHRRCIDAATAEVAGIGVQRSGTDWYFTFIAVDDATP
jgi:uncharacterized protein YkwD